MKRFLIIAALIAFAISTPVLACGGGCSAHKANQTAAAKGFCIKCATHGVEKSVNNLDNGVEIHFAVADRAAAEKLYKAIQAHEKEVISCAGQCPVKAKGVERNVKLVKDGVVFVATSPDAEMAKYLQERAQKMLGA